MLHVIVAEVLATPVVATAEIRGAGLLLPPPTQVRTVIEYAGSENGAEGLKFEAVVETGTTTFAVSLVSVGCDEVSC